MSTSEMRRRILSRETAHRSHLARPSVNQQVVSPEGFCELAVSFRPLDRLDNIVAGWKGLIDRETGECFVTEENELFHVRAFA